MTVKQGIITHWKSEAVNSKSLIFHSYHIYVMYMTCILHIVLHIFITKTVGCTQLDEQHIFIYINCILYHDSETRNHNPLKVWSSKFKISDISFLSYICQETINKWCSCTTRHQLQPYKWCHKLINRLQTMHARLASIMNIPKNNFSFRWKFFLISLLSHAY